MADLLEPVPPSAAAEHAPGQSGPVGSAAAEDTGAETLQRYRYQAAYAAWLAVGSLEQVQNIAAVYCEHHDDVLIEFHDGLCDAVQVKTQADGVGPLKGTAKPVLGALRRFTGLEQSFGSHFRAYRLASIAGFHRVGKAASNLPHCLDQARACSNPAAPEVPLSSLIKQMKLDKAVPLQLVVATLAKVELDPTLPKLEDIQLRVQQTIERLPETADYRASDLYYAVEAVIRLAVRAGEATAGTAASDYVSYLANPAEHATKAAIEAKRLSPARVREAILAAADEAATLRSKAGSSVLQLPAGTGVAHRKLDAGGVPVHAVALLDDLRSSAEDAISRRLYRDGAERVNRDYDHVQVLVRTLAEDARLVVRSDEGPYGQAMFAELRERLRSQAATAPDSVRGLSTEQLTGIAAILTELCQVWWSEPFDLGAGA